MTSVPMALFVRRFVTLTAVLAAAAVLVGDGRCRLARHRAAVALRRLRAELHVRDHRRRRQAGDLDRARHVPDLRPVGRRLRARRPVRHRRLHGLQGVRAVPALRPGSEHLHDAPGRRRGQGHLQGDVPAELDLHRPRPAPADRRPRRCSPRPAASTTPTAPASPYVPSANAGKPTTSVDPVGSALKTTNQLRGTLLASVDSAGKPKVTLNGKAIGTLKEGRYKTTVTDSSKTAGLVFNLLDKNGVPSRSLTASGVQFTGKKTATLTLKKGQWNFVAIGGSGEEELLHRRSAVELIPR